MLVIKQLMVAIYIHSIYFPTMESNGGLQLFDSSEFLKDSNIFFNIRNSYSFEMTWG